MRAKVTEIQVASTRPQIGGPEHFSSLLAVPYSLAMIVKQGLVPQISFSIQLPNGMMKTITIRDDAKGTTIW